MRASLPRRRRILYVAPLGRGNTSAYRYQALLRLDQEVLPFDPTSYVPANRILQRVRIRYPFGPFVARVNRDLVRVAQEFRPDVVWFDKPTVFTPETLRLIQKTGAKAVFYVQDAPFGPRTDRCWGQFVKAFRIADLHCLFRQADVPRYQGWGLPFIKIMLSFDPQMHVSAPVGFSDAERNREISYIGFPYEQRPAFLLKLARDHKLPVFINGDQWRHKLTAGELRRFNFGGYLADEQYREGIWRSKINISFITQDNEEDIAHKAVEIAGCGGFLMALRTPGHQAIFEEDREAVFFSSVEECAGKCRFYLGRPDLREAIAARGHERAVRCGYDNDTQLARVLNRLDGKED